MARIARVGDKTSHGGAILSGSSDVKANNKAEARVGDPVSCPTHGTNTIVGGSSTVSANNKKKARIGDSCACGATIVEGSPDVNAG
jgi:uncharacterized Zn-binding protein involved in type VI secretion